MINMKIKLIKSIFKYLIIPFKLLFYFIFQNLIAIFLIISSPIDCILATFFPIFVYKLKLKQYKTRILIIEKELLKLNFLKK